MPDVPTGIGQMPGADRLNALRQNAPSQVGLMTPRKIRMELLVGVGAFLVLLTVLIFLFGSRTPSVSPSSSVATNAQDVIGTLKNGEAFVAMALEEGDFPPDVRQGDQVRLIVTPNADGSGTTRALDESTVVESISNTSEVSGRFVMTVRAPESVAIALASSGSVHVAVIREAQS